MHDAVELARDLIRCPSVTPAEGVAIDDGNIRVQAAINGQGIDLGSLELLTDELASGRLIQPFGNILEAGGYYLTYPAETLLVDRISVPGEDLDWK